MATKALYILPHFHPFTHSFIHQRWCQPYKAPSSSSGAAGVLLMYTSTLGQVEPGTDPPTFRFVDNLHEPLSHCCIYYSHTMQDSRFCQTVIPRVAVEYLYCQIALTQRCLCTHSLIPSPCIPVPVQYDVSWNEWK